MESALKVGHTLYTALFKNALCGLSSDRGTQVTDCHIDSLEMCLISDRRAFEAMRAFEALHHMEWVPRAIGIDLVMTHECFGRPSAHQYRGVELPR
jgi:hypothetical protein